MLGFYVHHHGRGHLARTRALLDRGATPAVVISELDIDDGLLPPDVRAVRLPPDTADGPGTDPTAGGALHWAPTGHRTRARGAAFVDALAAGEIEVLVVDVSVEAAVTARLYGAEVVTVRQMGDRCDRAHRLGADVSTLHLAPWPVQLESPDADPALVAGTRHMGLVSRHAGRVLDRAVARLQLGRAPDEKVATVVVGRGGTEVTPDDLVALARSLGGWTVLVVGGVSVTDLPGLVALGWQADPFPALAAADVVIGHSGLGVVSDTAAAGRPFVAVPEQRPFREQERTAGRLADLGAAVVAEGWDHGNWAALVDEAASLGGSTLASMVDPGRIEETARLLTTLG